MSSARALGLDVGSTTVKLVALGDGETLLYHRCERHHGRPAERARDLYSQAGAAFSGAPLGITGSVGVAMAAALCGRPMHEVHAVALAVEKRHPGTQSVVELGGQDAKVLLFDQRGQGHAEMNDRCAAGTGATIDRVAARIGLSERELGRLTLVGDLSVAAKCGVFAETDVVNLIKQGGSPAAAFSALARGIVVQNLAVLTRGRVPRPPVLLLGGPHAHLPILRQAWREALEELWASQGVATGPVSAPDHAALFAAIGAAEHAARGGRRLPAVGGALDDPRAEPPLMNGEQSGRAQLTPRATAPAGQTPSPPGYRRRLDDEQDRAAR